MYKRQGWALRIYMAGSLFFGIQIACQQTFVALGQAKISLLMALLRKIVLLIPLVYIPVSYTHLDVYKRQPKLRRLFHDSTALTVL